MTRLALLRHGHTAWNRDGKIQGRTDIPLDADAEAQLSRLRLPPPWDHATLWSSPLSRARRTAELVTGQAPRTDAALTEMDWGRWEGQRRADLFADPAQDYRHIEDWGWHHAPPDGESAGRLRDRLLPWVATLSGDNIAVCHIGVMRVLLARAHGWDFDGPAPFQVKRNRLYVIDLSAPAWQADPEPQHLLEGEA